MDFNSILGYSMPGIGGGQAFIMLLVVWELIWKGLALWKAAQNKETAWYVAILILNTVGILPILYLYVFSKKSK